MGVQERRERERQARRSSVLDAARSLVLELGFNRTTTKMIAERCELSEATLFFYFQNKDEIFLSLLYEGIDFTADALDELLAADFPASQRLQKMWNLYSLINREHPEYVHVFGYLARPLATANISEEVKAEIARRTGDNFRRLASFLEGVVPGAQTRIAADLVWSTFIGLISLRQTRHNLGAPEHPTSSELQAEFEMLMRGLATSLDMGDR